MAMVLESGLLKNAFQGHYVINDEFDCCLRHQNINDITILSR